jgi:hypothetical protein
MTISSNMHGVTGMEAGSNGGTTWLDITSKAGHYTIFMPLHVAEATALAFNVANVLSKEPAQ